MDQERYDSIVTRSIFYLFWTKRVRLLKKTFEGFHATSQTSVYDILNYGFNINFSRSNDWLGHGLYLFKNKADAQSWGKSAHYCKPNPQIIRCEIEVKKERYLNLDDPKSMNKYLEFFDDLLKHLSDNAKTIEFESREQAMCYGLNIYKHAHSIDLIKYTFRNPRTKRILKYKESALGYDYNEVQICASRNEVITSKILCS